MRGEREERRSGKRVWKVEKEVDKPGVGAKVVGMKRVAAYMTVPAKPTTSGSSSDGK